MKKQTAGEVGALVLLQFIINFAFISFYPEVAETPLRAGIMGSVAFIVLLLSGTLRGSYTHALVGTLSLFVSWYANASFVARGFIVSTSALSAISQIATLLLSYAVIGFAYRKLSALQPENR